MRVVCGAEAEVCGDQGGVEEEEGRKAQGKRKKKGKGKEREKGKVVERSEETEVKTEVKRLAGLMGRMRSELSELTRGYQKMRREMREWRD